MKSFHYKFHYELVIKARGDYHGLKMIVRFVFFPQHNLSSHLHAIQVKPLGLSQLTRREESNMREIDRVKKRGGTGVIKATSVFEGSVVSKRI